MLQDAVIQVAETLSQYRVLVIDDDRDVTDLVHAVLTDEGFAVSVLHDQRPDAIRAAVNRLEPDCVLLDGDSPHEYGDSWGHAAWISGRDRRVPLLMFSAHGAAVREVEDGRSERSKAAGFAGVLPKPFDLDQLVDLVRAAVGQAAPFETTTQAEAARTQALVDRLVASGAEDIQASSRREWTTFRTPRGTFMQLYWWQRDGVYYLVRYADTGGRLEPIGRFYDVDAAIAVALGSSTDAP
jgi:DNA-binding response OmpR family regulator